VDNKRIHINADVGEAANISTSNDAVIMPFLQACNIACGFHAGNEKMAQEAIKIALKYNVKIGAHPSYPDKENFGRIKMDLPYEQLVKIVKTQIHWLTKQAKIQNTILHHVKPHGALYNTASVDTTTAEAIVEAVSSFRDLKLFAAYGSVLSKVGKDSKLEVVDEAFIDRTYHHDLSLVSRSNENAVINKPEQAIKQVVGIAKENTIKPLEGGLVAIKADTYCIHGDNPNAHAILSYLQMHLPQHELSL